MRNLLNRKPLARGVRRLRRPEATHDTPKTWEGLPNSSVGVGSFPGDASDAPSASGVARYHLSEGFADSSSPLTDY
jgi:hypothetical protein